MINLQLELSNDIDTIKYLVQEEGYCPVECSIGDSSIIDELIMDHHGKYSHLESVAIRSYRDMYGMRRKSPQFIGTGIADADMCFAIASLLAIIPHPDKELVTHLPSHIQEHQKRDVTKLAETIALVDTNPIGLNIPELPFGDILITWNCLQQNNNTQLGLYQGVSLWDSLLNGNQQQLQPFFNSAKEAEENRILNSQVDYIERAIDNESSVLVIKGSRYFEFDVWYQRIQSQPFYSKSGWKHPVVIAWQEKTKSVTIGCPNKEVAEELFGQGGLKNVFSYLKPEGWGGRETIGGSPRGLQITSQQLDQVKNTICSLIT